MIYPDVSLEDWLKKHQHLSQLDLTCGCEPTAWKPFVFRKKNINNYGVSCVLCNSSWWYSEDPEMAKALDELAQKL